MHALVVRMRAPVAEDRRAALRYGAHGSASPPPRGRRLRRVADRLTAGRARPFAPGPGSWAPVPSAVAVTTWAQSVGERTARPNRAAARKCVATGQAASGGFGGPPCLPAMCSYSAARYLDRGGRQKVTLMPCASMVAPVARSRLALASANRPSRAPRGCGRRSARSGAGAPGRRWRCRPGTGAARWRTAPRRTGARAGGVQAAIGPRRCACRALRTSASMAMPIWSRMACSLRPSASDDRDLRLGGPVAQGSEICTPICARREVAGEQVAERLAVAADEQTRVA